MRAFIHAFQGEPWNEECKTAYDGFAKLGVECVLFTTNEELEQRKPEDIVVGGDVSEYEHLNPESEILCNDVVNFISEWRCFIRYGEILGIQFYNGDEGAVCEKSIIEAAIADYKNMPAACSLDFGVTDDGRTLLIEMNDGFAIGCYGLQDELYAKFLYSRWAELVGVKDPWDVKLRQGYVEEFIQKENEKVWDAYLSIDVREKTGYEIVPDGLINAVENTSQYLGLEQFFEQNSEKEVYITDDVISLKKANDIYSVLHAIIGKDVLVHLRVDFDMIETINNCLEEEANKESQEEISFLKWRYSDRDYVLELMKRLPGWSTYIVRIYEDGNGVIAFSGENKLETSYFKMKEYKRRQIIENASKKIDEILLSPEYIMEDDRDFGFPVQLKYGVYWRCPDADKYLKMYQTFEDVEYSDDEFKIKLAKQIIAIPDVKAKWMKMHL